MTKLYVANLPYTLSESQLTELFTPFGIVEQAFIVFDKSSGKSKGFGFVEMKSDISAQQAIQKLHNSLFQKRKLVVNIARPKEEQTQATFILYEPEINQ